MTSEVIEPLSIESNAPKSDYLQEQSQEQNSFLELSGQINLNDKSKALELNSIKDMLLSSGGNRKKKRYTLDGRLCSSMFAQDGQTYFDCTANRSPDGQTKNMEWCYVSNSEKDGKSWDYCKPIMDYDKLREENQSQLGEITSSMRKVKSDLDKTSAEGQQPLDHIKRVIQGQAELDLKINNMFKELANLKNSLVNIFSIQGQWQSEENKSMKVAAMIQEKELKIKEEASKDRESKFDSNEDTIKREIIASGAVINPLIQERIPCSSFDCKGMLSYESEQLGDGLIGNYFNNEAFVGDFKVIKDSSIDFDWSGASPVVGINASNFSIRWEGFIFTPITSNYQFSIEVDDGASITLNNELIVSHSMYTSTSESNSRVDNWINEQLKIRNDPKGNHHKATSQPIKLSGGSKYKIVVSYFHSVHNDLSEDEKSYVKLYWSSDEFEEVIVPKNVLYSVNTFSALKVSGVTTEDGVVRNLLENDLAFKNSESYVIQDVPLEYRGSVALKLNANFKKPKLTFEINSPAIVFIGRLAHYPSPLPVDFEHTGQMASLLLLETPRNGSEEEKIKTSKSGLIKFYKKRFNTGKVEIPLSYQGLNGKGIPLIVFFGFDNQSSSPVSCGGKEELISNPNSKYFKECSQSSFYDSNWKCRFGLGTDVEDSAGHMWATSNEGKGAWIKIEFTDLFEISIIKFMNRRNNAERNKKIEVEFSDGNTMEFDLLNEGFWQDLSIDPPVKSSSVKIKVVDVFGTINNGGGVKVYGSLCIDLDVKTNDVAASLLATALEKVTGINPKTMPPLFGSPKDIPKTLTCKDSFSNAKKLDNIKQSIGAKVTVRCQENCSTSPSKIYGDLKYSKDSAICKAAFHSQKLPVEGGLVTVVFGAGLGEYQAQKRNGIQSKKRGKSDVTLTFEVASENDSIILETGSKVDFIDSNHPGNFLPTIISDINNKGDFKVLFLLSEKGDSTQKPYEVKYPNKTKVFPCGDKISGRDCKSSRKDLNLNQPIKIKFAPGTYNKAGDFIIDKGEIFGKSGKPIGWNKDMTDRMRLRQGGNKPQLDSFVQFPPSPKSKFCSDANPDVICDSATWSAKVGIGKFNVKLYIGDPNSNTRVDIKVNEKYFVQRQTLTAGTLYVYEEAIDSINEIINITSECMDDCKYSMSKLNMVEISPFKEGETAPATEIFPEKEDLCKNGYSGGRCNTGPDVLHCIYETLSPAAAKCTGDLVIMMVSDQYRCTSQRKKYKCVKRKYQTQQECLQFCPKNCKEGKCAK